MPRYFFNILGHPFGPDLEGSELADVRAAQAAAVTLCGDMIREIDGKFWEAPLWRLQVTNQDKKLLFTLTFSGEEHDPGASQA